MTGVKFEFTDEQINEIIRMYLAGDGSKLICNKFKCSYDIIRKLIKERNLQIPISKALENKAEICQKYINGESINNLKKQYGSTHETIVTILIENNITLRNNHSTPELQEQLCNEYVAGTTLRELSRKYGIERNLIRRYLIARNIEVKGSTYLKHVPINIQESVRDDLLSLKYNCVEAADKYNLANKTVRKIAAKYDIKEFKPQKSHRKIHFNDKDRDNIIKSYGKTETLLSLSKIYKISRSVIKQLLIDNGVQPLEKQISNDLRERNKYITSISLQIIVDYQNNLSIHDIKDKYGMSFERILKVLNKNNIELKPKGFYTKIRFTKEQEDEIVKLYLGGMVGYLIAPLFGVSYPAISAVLNKHEIRIKKGPPLPKTHRSWGVSGTYNGFEFLSMNELSFIINYIEVKNLKAVQCVNKCENTSCLPYYHRKDDRLRDYFWDFKLSNGLFIEIKPKAFWNDEQVLDKKIYALAYAHDHNLKYLLVDYPVIIEPILDKYFNDEIKFTAQGLEKFTRIYKKYLI